MKEDYRESPWMICQTTCSNDFNFASWVVVQVTQDLIDICNNVHLALVTAKGVLNKDVKYPVLHVQVFEERWLEHLPEFVTIEEDVFEGWVRIPDPDLMLRLATALNRESFYTLKAFEKYESRVTSQRLLHDGADVFWFECSHRDVNGSCESSAFRIEDLVSMRES